MLKGKESFLFLKSSVLKNGRKEGKGKRRMGEGGKKGRNTEGKGVRKKIGRSNIIRQREGGDEWYKIL